MCFLSIFPFFASKPVSGPDLIALDHCQKSVRLSYLSGLEGLTLVCHSNADEEWQTSVSPSSAISSKACGGLPEY